MLSVAFLRYLEVLIIRSIHIGTFYPPKSDAPGIFRAQRVAPNPPLHQTRNSLYVAGEAQTIAQEAVDKVLEGRRYSHGKVRQRGRIVECTVLLAVLG